MRKCRNCRNDTRNVINFGETALANSFLTESELNDPNFVEKKYDLSYSLCPVCGLFQLNNAVDPDVLFKNYFYSSSTSGNLVNYFKNYADSLIKDFSLNENSFVIEPACNDGVMLQHFQEKGIPCLGIEPATNLVKVARDKGLQVVNEFFNVGSAQKIVDIGRKKANLVTFNNVFAHLEGIHEFLDAVDVILSRDGVFCFENSYLGAMIENNLFDVLYHEHIFEYSILPLSILMEKHGFQIFRVEFTSPHGGSFRAFCQRKGGRQFVGDQVQEIILREASVGLFDLNRYKSFNKDLLTLKSKLKNKISDIQRLGGSICGYGYPAKATTLCNFFEIGDVFDYVVEDSPLKVGKYTPQFHVPVKDSAYFKENPTTHCIVLAWNFYDLILKNNQQYKGEWINPLS